MSEQTGEINRPENNEGASSSSSSSNMGNMQINAPIAEQITQAGEPRSQQEVMEMIGNMTWMEAKQREELAQLIRAIPLMQRQAPIIPSQLIQDPIPRRPVTVTTTTTALVKEQKPVWDACPEMDHRKENTVWPFWWYFERVLGKALIPQEAWISRMLTCPKIVEPTQNVIEKLLTRMKEEMDPEADDYHRFTRKICTTWGWVDPERECLFHMAHLKAPNKALFRIVIEDWHNIYLRIRRFKGMHDHDMSILLKYYFQQLPETVSTELRQEASELLRKGDNGNDVYEKMVRKVPFLMGNTILEDTEKTNTIKQATIKDPKWTPEQKWNQGTYRGKRNEGTPQQTDPKRQRNQPQQFQFPKPPQAQQQYVRNQTRNVPQQQNQNDPNKPRFRNRKCWHCGQRDCPDRRECGNRARAARAIGRDQQKGSNQINASMDNQTSQTSGNNTNTNPQLT